MSHLLSTDAKVIRNRALVNNLRLRWPEELKPYSDTALVRCYEMFSLSDDYGDNDKLFPCWFSMLEMCDPAKPCEENSQQAEG